MPTVAAGPVMSSDSRASRVAVAEFDELLFRPESWFAIDSSNRRVAGVVVPTRVAGLGLVGRGAVATIVGKLRPEAMVVDIDVDQWRGDWVVEQLADWCKQRGLWWLARPSGGGAGRWHVFVVPQNQRAALAARVEQLRDKLGAARTEVDLRDTVRPLSAPHRHGTNPPPLLGRNPEAVRRALERLLGSPAAATDHGLRRLSRAAAEPLVPRPRQRRDLPAEWELYLASSTRPELGGTDHSRSTYEVVCTAMMVRAGWDAETAWQRILTAHPAAMDKARTNRDRWTRVWNRAVREDLQQPARHTIDQPVADAVHAAQEQLWGLQPGQRGRTSVLRVGLALLDRMLRTNSLRVPCAERNLVLDTGITDRKTIRAALRTLHQHGIGHLHTDTLTPDRQHSYEFEIPTAPNGAGQIPPPSFHNPPPGTWPTLPPSASLLWHYLHPRPEHGTSPAELAKTTGSVRAGSTPTPDQIRTLTGVLRAMGRAGLVACDERGLWRATTPDASAPETRRAQTAAAAAHRELREAIEVERHDYRSRRLSAWGRQRADAIERDHDRHRKWWASLSVEQQETRRRNAAARFQSLPCHDQEELKHRWATRRVRAGHDEATRYRQWLASLPAAEFERRRQERRLHHGNRPRAEQYVLARSWDRHRLRFGIPRGRDGDLPLPLIA